MKILILILLLCVASEKDIFEVKPDWYGQGER